MVLSQQNSAALRPGENTELLQLDPLQQEHRTPHSKAAIVYLALLLAASTLGVYHSSGHSNNVSVLRGGEWNLADSLWEYPRDKEQDIVSTVKWKPPEVTKRCDWVVEVFTEKNEGMSEQALSEKYNKQAEDANAFYRATAEIFWRDCAGGWGNFSFGDLGIDAKLDDGSPVDDKSTWTWVTGDQHLSNFGAWRNRHGTVVFSVNDFDEAAIYDFHVDVLRIAVSICNHAYTNQLSKKDRKKALRAFTDTYVQTVVNYVGNEDALTYELTVKTATGALKKFLQQVETDKSHTAQLDKYTDVDSAGARRFTRNNETRLEDVSPELENKIRSAFTSDKYGATMMKTGWHVPVWNNNYFTIIDVARRLGSGIGSYGVDRYYVLLKGRDTNSGRAMGAIILDVKFEPTPAVSSVLDKDDAAWYKVMFQNEAARAVEAQRRLTSYVDPFTGWVLVDDEALVVRQRSPWKDSPDLDALTDPKDFNEFMTQVAVATATSHVRGTVAKSPGQFKQVIASVLGNKSTLKRWGNAVALVAENYHNQVELDYECFKEYVQLNYPQEG